MLRTVAFEWRHEDWFAALKAGFLAVAGGEIDHLENEALAHGWNGPAWLRPLVSVEQPREAERCSG